jgi:hypothetical protein
VPSAGAEALAFNQLGNEVILTKASTVVKVSVSVTMTDFSCQTGSGVTSPRQQEPRSQRRSPSPLYKHSTTDATAGEVTPGAQITKATKTFNIKFRPSADPTCADPSKFKGSDNACHSALDQNVVWDLPKNTKLPATVVWGISYNTDNSGPNPIGGSGAPPRRAEHRLHSQGHYWSQPRRLVDLLGHPKLRKRVQQPVRHRRLQPRRPGPGLGQPRPRRQAHPRLATTDDRGGSGNPSRPIRPAIDSAETSWKKALAICAAAWES